MACMPQYLSTKHLQVSPDNMKHKINIIHPQAAMPHKVRYLYKCLYIHIPDVGFALGNFFSFKLSSVGM